MKNVNLKNTLLYNIFLNTIDFEYPYNVFMSNEMTIIGRFKKTNQLYKFECIGGVLFSNNGMYKVKNYSFDITNFVYHKYSEYEHNLFLKIIKEKFNNIKCLLTQLTRIYNNEINKQNVLKVQNTFPPFKCDNIYAYNFFKPNGTNEEFKTYKQEWEIRKKEFYDIYRNKENYIGKVFLDADKQLFLIKKIDKNECIFNGEKIYISLDGISYSVGVNISFIKEWIRIPNELYIDIKEKYNEIIMLNNL